MAKLPWMQFYPADYLLDTQPLSLASRGVWMDLICMLWRSETRGVLSYRKAQWQSLLRCTEIELDSALDEFTTFTICDIETLSNGFVTLSCRRMKKDEKCRKAIRLRVSRHRRNKACNEPVPDCNQESHISEVRSQNQKSESEVREEKKEGEGSGEIRVLEPRSSAPRGCVYPETFEPDERAIALTASYGLNVHKLHAAFKDHHRARGTVFKDWQAAFRNWIRNEVKFSKRGTHAL